METEDGSVVGNFVARLEEKTTYTELFACPIYIIIFVNIIKKIVLITFALACVATGLTFTTVAKNAETNLLLSNLEALADDSESSQFWFREDKDCTWSGTGKKSSSLTVTIGGNEYSVGTNSNGEWTYTVTGGRTNCTSGGHEQCSARYCDN